MGWWWWWWVRPMLGGGGERFVCVSSCFCLLQVQVRLMEGPAQNQRHDYMKTMVKPVYKGGSESATPSSEMRAKALFRCFD